MNQIEIDEKFLEEFQKETYEYFESQKSTYKIEWKYTGLIFIVSCSLLFFYLKPNFGNLLNFYEGYSVIEIKEIAFKNQESEHKPGQPEDNPLAPTETLSDADVMVANLTEPNPKTVPEPPAGSKPKVETAKPVESNTPPTATAKPVQPVAPPQPPPTASTAPTSATTAAATTTAVNETSADTVAEADNKKNQQKMAGGLYRAELSVKDFEQNTLFTKEKIINYGGKKAGEVELGWVKNKKTSYFHFSIPEENIEKLKTDLGLLGKLDISFHAHPRLMPVGTKRVILEVKLVD